MLCCFSKEKKIVTNINSSRLLLSLLLLSISLMALGGTNYGNLEVSKLHEGSPVVDLLRQERKVRVFVQPEQQVDFSPSRDVGILYLGEDEIVMKSGEWTSRLMTLTKFKRSFVIVEKTPVTEQYFNTIQMEAAFGSLSLQPL